MSTQAEAAVKNLPNLSDNHAQTHVYGESQGVDLTSVLPEGAVIESIEIEPNVAVSVFVFEDGSVLDPHGRGVYDSLYTAKMAAIQQYNQDIVPNYDVEDMKNRAINNYDLEL